MARLGQSCQEVFLQPEVEPKSNIRFLDATAGHRRRAKEVQASAHSGCHLCIIVWGHYGVASLCTQREIEDIDLVCGLSWDPQRAVFNGIQYWAYGADGCLDYDLVTIDMYLQSDIKVMAPNSLVPLDTESEICHTIALTWLHECYTNHTECRVAMNASPWCPTRLIDVRTPTGDPRLVVSADMNGLSAVPYVCLSHLWDAGSVFPLTTANEDDLRQQIPFADLSPTFQDAIRFTRRLGVRFLWIDSLCILQDSISDWRIESALMDKVYEYSICNIAATAASENSGGLYQRRDPRVVTPRQVQITRQGHIGTYVFFEGQT
ncbi:heterokaryon incompatibility protein-domain-containing protein [Tricladium varicosporioides]|nr:heterokaryon incompatibility protein-domain-containing protein [Hymenoscyphus varicosporioides]